MSINKEKIAFFEEKILGFFQKAGREHLPWREPRGGALRGKKKITAYEVWVSEIMLQQTQVNRVIEYYTRFLKRFPTVESLARASWEEFLPYYQGLGYYARGRNMIKAARVIVSDHRGKFPHDKIALQNIPGIGPYTASAILSFAYGENHLAWDTNLRRAIGRYFLGAKHLAGESKEWEGRFALPRKTLNAALMDFGSAICTARPKCGICPLQTKCVYFREDGEKEKTEKKVREKFPLESAQTIVFLHAYHRSYYSSVKKAYSPFHLSARLHTRAAIKAYFEKHHGLKVSVRPPHKKMYVKGVPTLLVNAQILLGNPKFQIFEKEAARAYAKLHLL